MFDKNDWAHLHDAVYTATGNKSSQEELETIYDKLPDSLKGLAVAWGMNDTVFREEVIEYLENKAK